MIRLSIQAPIDFNGRTIRRKTLRAGAAALDYILAIGIVFPLLVVLGTILLSLILHSLI